MCVVYVWYMSGICVLCGVYVCSVCVCSVCVYVYGMCGVLGSMCIWDICVVCL